MMIPISNKVLKSINYLCYNDASTSSLDIAIHFHNRINKLDLLNTIGYLVEQGYIIGINQGTYWEDIQPTYKGKHYKAFNLVIIKEFIFKSMLVPIGVSFFTSLITYLLFH